MFRLSQTITQAWPEDVLSTKAIVKLCMKRSERWILGCYNTESLQSTLTFCQHLYKVQNKIMFTYFVPTQPAVWPCSLAAVYFFKAASFSLISPRSVCPLTSLRKNKNGRVVFSILLLLLLLVVTTYRIGSQKYPPPR